MSNLLKINALTINIGLRTLFRDLYLDIDLSDFILLSGENGIGKSTLLKSIFRRHRDKEFVWNPLLDGQKISYLGHEPGLYGTLSLHQNLEYFRGISRLPISRERERELIEGFNLQKRLRDPIHTFSEGMRRKSGILRALIPNPLCLLLDEPFNGLDSNSVGVLRDFLEVQSRFSTILIVSHDYEKFKTLINKHIEIIHGKCIVKK